MLRIVLLVAVVLTVIAAVGIALFYLARKSQVRNKYILAAALLAFVMLMFVLPTIFFTKVLTVWELFAWASSSINEYLGISVWLGRAIVAAAVVPFLWAIRMIFSFRSERRRIGAVVVVTFICGYFILMYFGTRENMFTHTTGQVQKWVYIDRGKVVRLYDSDGYDVVTGEPLLPMTSELQERIAYLEHMDPSEIDNESAYFDLGSGKPVKWYSINENGAIQLYDHPGFDPRSQRELKPVTPDIAEAYEVARAAKERELAHQQAEEQDEEARIRREREALAFRSRYVDTRISNSDGETDIALLLVGSGLSEKGERIVDQVSHSVIGEILKSAGYSVCGNPFTRAFITDGKLAELMEGRSGILNQLRVAAIADFVLVGETSEDFFSESRLKDTRSCRYRLSLTSYDANGKIGFQGVFSSTGIGFDDTTAKKKAIERLMPDVLKKLGSQD